MRTVRLGRVLATRFFTPSPFGRSVAEPVAPTWQPKAEQGEALDESMRPQATPSLLGAGKVWKEVGLKKTPFKGSESPRWA